MEATYPAEFLTVMHSSNEEEFKLHSTDSDRFLTLYRLRQKKNNGVITEEVYTANQEQIERGIIKDETRQGLGNLLRSPILSAAIMQVLQKPHLRPGFNASTWGKKLTKGRFYQAGGSVDAGQTALLTDEIFYTACCRSY